jgi:hypothetical protein
MLFGFIPESCSPCPGFPTQSLPFEAEVQEHGYKQTGDHDGGESSIRIDRGARSTEVNHPLSGVGNECRPAPFVARERRLRVSYAAANSEVSTTAANATIGARAKSLISVTRNAVAAGEWTRRWSHSCIGVTNDGENHRERD